MPSFQSSNGPIYFEQMGSRSAPTVLMIHGLGCQTIHWPESMLRTIVDAGFRVVIFDNRDVGYSFEVEKSSPDIMHLLEALNDPNCFEPPYTLEEMAEDVVQLLNHIGQSGAHIIGVSMGGMIAQHLAFRFPERIFSLVLLMCSSGNPKVPGASAEAIGALASTLVSADRESDIESAKAASRIFGGPHYDSCEHGIGRFCERAYDRARRPDGTTRQLAAILCDGDRSSRLTQVSIPTLLIHGDHDALVNPKGSDDLARLLPNAELVVVKNLGHDLSEPAIPFICDNIVRHLHNVPILR